MLFRLLDWFLRRHHGISDESRMRARLVIGLLLINIIVLACITIGLLVTVGSDKLYLSLMMADVIPVALFYVGSLVYFSRTLGFTLTGNLFLSAQGGAMVTGIVMTGGTSTSPMLSMLVVVAIYAFLLLGLRGGLWWSVIVVVTLIGLNLSESLGYYSPNLVPPQYMELYKVATPVILLLTSIIALVLYEVITTNLRQALAVERNQFAYLAAHDPLTGLANRDEFQRNLLFAIRQAQLRQRHCAVIYIDLDRFKPINDRFGHAAGDMVLRTISQRLQQFVRGSDIVARLGGDEFAVILMGLQSIEDASIMAGNLRKIIEEPIPHQADTLTVGASFGMAIYPDMADSATELLRLADSAMYAAKHAKHKAAHA